jgi:hypothetical protein
VHVEVLPERVPAAVLPILRGGEPRKPEVTLSPLQDHSTTRHCAEIEAVVPGIDRDPATQSGRASFRGRPAFFCPNARFHGNSR